MKYNVITLVFFISIFILQSPLSADCVSEEDSFLFRMKIKDRLFQEASEELERLSSKCPDNTRLELLETELWIEQGEDLYKRKQFKSAFPFYKNSYSRWRTNPLIKQRYNELSGKILTDEPQTRFLKKANLTNTNEETIEPPTTQEEVFVWEDKEKWFEQLRVLQERVWILTLLAGASIIFSLIAVSALTINLLRKK